MSYLQRCHIWASSSLSLSGSEIVDRVIVGTAKWSELFAKHDFFHKYRYYLQVIASTGRPELQIKWYALVLLLGFMNENTTDNRSGTVESRIRQLVMKLEYVDSLTLAHPFIKGFEQVSHCLTDDEVRAVAQGEILEAVAKRRKEDIEGKEGASTVYSTTFYIGLAIEPKQRTSCCAAPHIPLVQTCWLNSVLGKLALPALESWTYHTLLQNLPS